ncbi:MAG: hypothetical protein IJI14_04475 [Anaerolineaceae bacterium]|nr:hypothetical protein [Anaerolineaceae bacterium]
MNQCRIAAKSDRFREEIHEAPETSVPILVRIISGACAPWRQGEWCTCAPDMETMVHEATVNHDTWCGCT